MRTHAAADLAVAVVWFPVVGGLIGAAVGGVAAGLGEVVPASVAAAVAVLFGIAAHGRVPRGRARRHRRRPGGRVDPRAASRDPGRPAPRQLRRGRTVRINRPPRRGRGHADAVGRVRRAGRGARPRARRRGGHDGGRAAGQAGRPRCGLRPLGDRTSGRQPRGLVAVGIATLATGWWVGPLAAAAVASAVLVAYFAWRTIGGITGDVLGAIEQVAECAVLVVVTGLAAVSIRWRTDRPHAETLEWPKPRMITPQASAKRRIPSSRSSSARAKEKRA